MNPMYERSSRPVRQKETSFWSEEIICPVCESDRVNEERANSFSCNRCGVNWKVR